MNPNFSSLVDREPKKIMAARTLTKLVEFVAKGKTKYEPKFQLSSSNSLGDMSLFVTENED